MTNTSASEFRSRAREVLELVADKEGQLLPPLAEFVNTAEWAQLSAAAARALNGLAVVINEKTPGKGTTIRDHPCASTQLKSLKTTQAVDHW